MFTRFAETADRIAATPRTSEKRDILADYLRHLDDPTLERAVTFFTGFAFAHRDERVTGVGWATTMEAAAAVTGRPPEEITALAIDRGDLGDALSTVFPAESPGDPLSVVEVGENFDHLAATSGGAAKGDILRALFARASAPEARFLAKILLGEFRIGLREGLVEQAIAEAFGHTVKEVRRAFMFNGDLGATALLARSDALHEPAMTLFHPIGAMLAQPEEDPAAILESLGDGCLADDKYDGIRAQLHADGEKVRIYSRTLDEITPRFPELVEAARELQGSVLLDGEIVAFREGVLPFATLQKRIGRRDPGERILASAPAVFFAFDVLYSDGEAVFERPLRERLEILHGIVPESGTIRRGWQTAVHSVEELEAAFDAARARANEGLVVKEPESVYTPGRRGGSWLKYKKALATLDCVVTAAQYGHGKRRSVLSDYTFAVRREDELVNIGKAYSGLRDVEIEELTERFKAITISRHGPVHVVRPEVVLEIAFDRIQESKRHKSGYALRFPRIARIRDDKSVEEIATIDEVRRIYEGQLARENALPSPREE